MNPKTFSTVLSNTCGFATFILTPMLGLGITASPYTTSNAWIWAYSAIGYSYYCWISCL